MSQISEDEILGMTFLITHKCTMGFMQLVPQVYGKELTCIDRHGRLLLINIHVTRAVVVASWTEINIQSLPENFYLMRLIKGQLGNLPISSSMNRAGENG